MGRALRFSSKVSTVGLGLKVESRACLVSQELQVFLICGIEAQIEARSLQERDYRADKLTLKMNKDALNLSRPETVKSGCAGRLQKQKHMTK